MTPQSPRDLILRLGMLLQSVASRRQGDRSPDVADAILWESDARGEVTLVSRGWTQYTGQAQTEALGEGWTAAVHPEDRDAARAAFLDAIRGEAPFAIDYRLRRGDGAYRWAMASGRPRYGARGEMAGYVGSILDVHELSQAEEARRESERRLHEFLATLSHELRNPLAPLRNALQLLGLAERRDSELAPVHEMMARQVEHLVRLVDDLLEMSRITRGSFDLRREPVDLAAVVRNAAETSAPLIEAAAQRLELELPGAPVHMDGDPVRLTQILANLLNNAARYGGRGGEIRVRLERAGDAALVCVRDGGAGIAPELLPRLFDMFARGEDSGGLGIGLALARRLAEMHGGTIEARSDGPGTGAEFVVRLPLGAIAERKVVPGASETGKLSRKRILLVDDNRDAAHSLGMLLGFLGAEVELAHDGPAAIAAFARRRPAAVLLDIGLPGMDGYEVARRLRAGGADGVPIVALTGWGQEEHRRRAREAGFDRHLIKPADLGALRALLASL